MLMSIHMIRAASDSGLEGVTLAFDLVAEAAPIQQVQPRRPDEACELPGNACQRILGQVQVQPKIHLIAVELAQLRSTAWPRRTSGHAADGGYPTGARELERGRVDGFVLAEVVDDDGDLLLAVNEPAYAALLARGALGYRLGLGAVLVGVAVLTYWASRS